MILANDCCVGVGENGEGVPGFVGQVTRNFRRIDTDRHGPNPGRLELWQIFLNPSQLEVAVGSPVAAIKNQQDGLGRGRSGAGGEKLV